MKNLIHECARLEEENKRIRLLLKRVNNFLSGGLGEFFVNVRADTHQLKPAFAIGTMKVKKISNSKKMVDAWVVQEFVRPEIDTNFPVWKDISEQFCDYNDALTCLAQLIEWN